MSTALVTGVGGGIGAAIAERLRRDGVSVVITDRPGDQLESVALTLDLPFVACDLGNADAVSQLRDWTRQSVGLVDIIVNAAGGVCGQTGQPLEAITDSQWREVFAANVDSAFHLARAFLPELQSHKQTGRFVTISSGAGLRPSLTGIQAYTASKHALVGLTRQLAQEFGRHGITVNSIAPGFVLSNEASRRQWEAYGEQGQQVLVDRIFTRRLGTPEDIANAVAFLSGDEASWITGQVISVDGGIA